VEAFKPMHFCVVCTVPTGRTTHEVEGKGHFH
jgi:hypothetical protein